MLPYGKQSIDNTDIEAVADVLRSDWITTGPAVQEFELELANKVGSDHAVSLSNGTAALHACMHALGIGPGDEVLVPALTFVASANCIVYQGGTPVFIDVEPDTLLIDPVDVERKINSKTKAVITVDYAGQPCSYSSIRQITNYHNISLVSDSCHSLGGKYQGRSVGTIADLNVFSFHPVKTITSGEGGAVTTSNDAFAGHIRNFRNHGITSTHHQRSTLGGFAYEMTDLGFNYRMTDIQCALALNQLTKLEEFTSRRQEIAFAYDLAFLDLSWLEPLKRRSGVHHAYHLYVVKVLQEELGVDRDMVFKALRAENIGVNVHYAPVYWHPYYSDRGYKKKCCPVAEKSYTQILSLPIFPAMTNRDVEDVVSAIRKISEGFPDK